MKLVATIAVLALTIAIAFAGDVTKGAKEFKNVNSLW